MKVVLLTAGAAGMYCGSCMHDNALARALRERGVDCVLQPVYTPIRTDESALPTSTFFLAGFISICSSRCRGFAISQRRFVVLWIGLR